MNKKQPVLSFCIPTWNRANRVYETVSHILEYKGDDIEVVVSDNHSDDDTLEKLGTINDERLKIFTNPENIGAYNWPLVISRASGKWAALMSDEDIVCIENIPYFVSLLTDCEEKNVGAVIYSFKPNRVENYLCKDAFESMVLAGRLGGHITCHILNMRYFKLLDKDEYDFLNIKIPREEPQFKVMLDVLQDTPTDRLLTIDEVLCEYGKEEKKAANKKIVYDRNFAGESFEYRLIQFNALINRALSYKDDRRFESLISSIVERTIVMTTSRCAVLLTATENFERNPELWVAMREHYGSDIDTLSGYCLSHVKKLISICTEATGKDFSDYSISFEKAFGFEFDYEIPALPLPQTIIIGNMILNSIPRLYSVTGSQMYTTTGFLPGFTEKFLEFADTSKMIEALNDDDYDFVINYKPLKTHRALYLIGRAYLLKGDLETAYEYFKRYLYVVEHPKTLADIITGTMSIVYSYYYLGYISQRRGEINEAVKCFARCDELADLLVVRHRLNAKHLKLGQES